MSNDSRLLEMLDFGTIEARENLGDEMPVVIYRAFQYAVYDELAEGYGVETARSIIREAGRKVGLRFFGELDVEEGLPLNEFFAVVQKQLKELKMGILRIELADEELGKFQLAIAEDLDCSGLPMMGETVCFYDEGFLAGIFEAYTGREYDVLEIDCWATGGRVCRFTANPTA